MFRTFSTLALFFLASAASASCPTSTPADYSGQTINGFNFGSCPAKSLIGANFTGANLQGSTFASSDLTSADFTGAALGPSASFPPANFNGATLKDTIFVGAQMPATNFTFAKIHCADFSKSNLLEADFGALQEIVQDGSCRTKFVEASLDIDLITDANTIGQRGNWSASDFTDANFHGLDPNSINFRGQDINGAILTGTNFVGIDFSGANLSNVKFDEAFLQNTVFSHAALNGADFTGSAMTDSTFICAQAYGSAGGIQMPDGSPCPAAPAPVDATAPVNFNDATLDRSDFTGAQLSQAKLSGAVLTRGTFSHADLSQAVFEAEGASIPPAQVKFAIFDFAKFSQSRISSVDFSGCSMIGADFSGTTLSGTNFAGATMDTARFTKANIQQTDFSQTSLKSSDFVGAKISQITGAGKPTEFSCAQLGGADFSNASVSSALFNDAVMVDKQFCCKPKTKGAPPYCGIIDSLGVAYAQTIFPGVTGTSVRCPDNRLAQTTASGKDPAQLCTDTWRLAQNWTTTGCTASGQTTMWSINCSAKPGNVVKFADKNLKACILDALPQGQTEVLITTAEVIGAVNCPGRGISDITGLEHFTAMHTLDLSNNKLTNFSLSFVGNKTALVSLNLEANQLTSLDLSAIKPVQYLNVADNQLGGIVLSADTFLYSLNAQYNKLTSFVLPIQTTLLYADLSNNGLTDVLGPFAKDLTAMTSLGFLDLSNNALGTIGPVTKIISEKTPTGSAGGLLQRMYLQCNPNFSCGDLGEVNGTKYPAIGTAGCSKYIASSLSWVGQPHPNCN
ncbi:pentapeptide repeat-containing protein [Roseovarius aestuariivivens]|uniref:pentapeptide repeat-containing protein n=1 Tax=Roseovarius aestuariivivens TaxID=1888910 RepID=UPI0010806EE1|nr:pentapeptide repeat-containing protein [Roseovarius aestuariivivens]